MNRITQLLLLATLTLSISALGQVSSGNDSIYKLPYKNTYVKNVFVTENQYRTIKPQITHPGTFEEAQQILPSPHWDGHEDAIKMYWDAWRIAIRNIRQPEPNSGFVATYIDTAYNGNLFMWDDAFILMFARYGARFFPFQNTLDNFYAKQHPDGFICREIRADGADCFERYDPTSTGPNLIPWCEMIYYHQYGDLDRLHRIFPVLCGYYEWLRDNRTWRNGTYWSSGWGTGMDNMPRVQEHYSPIFSHGHMIWLDTNLQQIMTAYQLLEMGFYTERWQEIEDYETEALALTKYIRENLWDNSTGFLYDQYRDDTLCETKGIGAFWALHTDVLEEAELDRLVAHLEDESEFARPHPVPSLSADNPKYRPNGRYWQGGVWPSTNYMVINGLTKKGYHTLAYQIAARHYQAVMEVYKRSGTFYEYYAPETIEPGFMAREDFVGWGGLAPIALLIEYMIGIRADYVEKTIVWDLHQTEAHGIDRYPFGPDGMIDLHCDARKSTAQKPRVTVKSNVPFTLLVRYGDGQEERIEVTPNR
ncbi:MAG: trehalase family glycosidase [Porphyromonas sp.]|nr:trehalase family glycosidase [Porphyromonas sp.]